MPRLSTEGNKGFVQFRYSVLLVFVSLEVFLASAPDSVRAFVAIAEYVFLAVAMLANAQVGLMYLVSFTLLAMGSWSYVEGLTPSNFWGLRLVSVSFNIVFTLLITAWFTVKRGSAAGVSTSKVIAPMIVGFIGYSLIVGMVSVALSINYLDNFINDALVYLPFLAYSYLLSRLDKDAVRQIVTHGLSVTIVAMMLSYITGNYFRYGGEIHFVLMNSFGFVVVFAIFFARRLYSPVHYYCLVGCVIWLLTSGSVFLGGKTIIVMAAALVWGVVTSRRPLVAIAALGLLSTVLLDPLLQAIAALPEGGLLAYKLNQIADVFKLRSVEALSTTSTSMGNLSAEARTIASYLKEHPLVLCFGKGFGAGVPDLFGDLTNFTGAGAGYSEVAAARNEYVRMHLPIFEIALKAGALGLGFYVLMVVRTIRSRSIFGFAAVILLLTVATNSKEMLLLTGVLIVLGVRGEGALVSADDGPGGEVATLAAGRPRLRPRWGEPRLVSVNGRPLGAINSRGHMRPRA